MSKQNKVDDLSEEPYGPTICVDSTTAERLNRELLEKLIGDLVHDPNTNLLHQVPQSYRSKMADRQPTLQTAKRDSKLAALNLQVIDDMLRRIETDPSSNLVDVFSTGYPSKPTLVN